MLTRQVQRGVTLVELLVVMGLMAVLMLAAAPNIGTWIRNNQIRTAAEALQNGLQTAKAEAVRRNTQARFQLVSNLTDSCALSTTGPDWIVSLDAATGACAHAIDVDGVTAPRIVRRRAGSEGTSSTVITSGQSNIVLNGLGRMPAAAAAVTIDVSYGNGTCVANGGETRCLRLTVTPNGLVRMCDPDPAFVTRGDPRRC